MPNPQNKLMTVDDEKFIVEQYTKNKKSAMMILKLLNNKFKTTKTIYDILRKYNISTENRCYGFYTSLDHFYFNEIDNANKAYILGLLIADGWVHPPQKQIGLSLQEDDKYIIGIVKKEFKSSNTIVRRRFNDRKKIMGRMVNRKDMYQLIVYSQQMITDLAKYGVVKRKTCKVVFPFISNELQPHLLRGILDGDGTIYTHSNGKLTCIRFLGSHYLVAQISLFLHMILGVKQKVPHLVCTGSEFTSYVEWTMLEDVRVIIDYLYNFDYEYLYFRRKYEKVKDFINKEKRQRTNLQPNDEK